MTISDLRCDVCDALLTGLTAGPGGDSPGGGVRFSYHPGDPGMRDDSGLLCGACWSEWTYLLGEPRVRVCAACDTAVARTSSLHLRRFGAHSTWQLCPPHAAELLNRLRTVQPKFDPATFQLPLERRRPRSSDA